MRFRRRGDRLFRLLGCLHHRLRPFRFSLHMEEARDALITLFNGSRKRLGYLNFGAMVRCAVLCLV
jgi:hypothetical protein